MSPSGQAIEVARFAMFVQGDDPYVLSENVDTEFDVFVSYRWGIVQLGRDNATRVEKVVEYLRNKKLKIWWDRHNVEDDVQAAMAEGIARSRMALVFITGGYIDKVNDGTRNNVRKEFQNITRAHPFVPVMMEPDLDKREDWVVGTFAFQRMDETYADFSANDAIPNKLEML